MVKRFMLKVLCKVIPKKGKKIIFLTNLYLKLCLLEPGDIDQLKGLNGELHLVEDLNALKIPMKLYRLIWRDMALNIRSNDKCRSGFSDSEVRHMSERFVKQAAQCLGSAVEDEGILEDTYKLVKYVINKNDGYIPFYCTGCTI